MRTDLGRRRDSGGWRIAFECGDREIRWENRCGREGKLPGVLELWGGLLLDAEDDGVGAADADGGVALADGLEGVLDLEEVAVGGEDGDRAVV